MVGKALRHFNPAHSPEPEPSWSSVRAAAHISRRTPGEILGAALSGRIRTQRIRGSLFVAIEDAMELAAEPSAPVPAPPLVRHVQDHRRRREAASELPLFRDGDGAERGGA
jgi:hypothetical protein